MPNINPPVDREEAVNHPVYAHLDVAGEIEIRIGVGKEGPPGTDNFRYIVIYTGNTREVWQGYLYKELTMPFDDEPTIVELALEYISDHMEETVRAIMSYGEDLDLTSTSKFPEEESRFIKQTSQYHGEHEKARANRDILEGAAKTFMEEVGLSPTPDAIGQLIDAFVPALQIICERDYEPNGGSWREKGWRGLVHDILDNAGRLRFRSWVHSRFDRNSATDMINFCGFYLRLQNEGTPWGDWPDPGSGIDVL